MGVVGYGDLAGGYGWIVGGVDTIVGTHGSPASKMLGSDVVVDCNVISCLVSYLYPLFMSLALICD